MLVRQFDLQIGLPFFTRRGLRGDNSISARPDGDSLGRWLCGGIFHEWRMIDLMVVQRLVQSPCVIGVAISRKRRTQRNHQRAGFRIPLRKGTRIKTAQAPADQNNLPRRRLTKLNQAFSNPVDGSGLGAEVHTLAPTMRLKPGYVKRGAQKRRRTIARQHARNDQNGSTFAELRPRGRRTQGCDHDLGQRQQLLHPPPKRRGSGLVAGQTLNPRSESDRPTASPSA